MRKLLLPLVYRLSILLCILLLVSCNGTDVDGSGEDSAVLLSNARIYTFDAGNTTLDSGSMAFSEDGKILGIGDNEPMLRAFSTARRIDMSGKTVIPGLIDSHGHLFGLALSFTRANLAGTTAPWIGHRSFRGVNSTGLLCPQGHKQLAGFKPELTRS